MAKKAIIDTPLSELILRKYEKPEKLEKRELVKKLCLSLGLLQPGDSRDVIVDILFVLLEAKQTEKFLSSEIVREKVIELRKNKELPLHGVASSNVRRQIKRLRDLFIVEKIKNKYRISEFSDLLEIFQEKITQYLLPNIMNRVNDYIQEIDRTTL